MKEKIYLIPGLMTDERLWSRLTPLLKDYELIHIPIPNSENFDEIAYILNEKIEDENINLLGFSLGGYVASYFTTKFPNKVKKLFLVASTPSSTNIEHIKKRREKLEAMKTSEFKTLSYEKAKLLMENKEDKEGIDILINMYSSLGEKVFRTQLISTLNRIRLEDAFLNLKIPITMFYSINDRLFNHDSIQYLIENNKNINIFSRQGTSHNIPLEVPFDLSLKIKEWIKN